MSKKNRKNKKGNFISKEKLAEALNIKKESKVEEVKAEEVKETKMVEEIKTEEVKDVEYKEVEKETKENKNNIIDFKSAKESKEKQKKEKKSKKKGYITSDDLNLNERVTVEDIIKEETKKDLDQIDADLSIANELEEERYRTIDTFKLDKVLNTLYTIDCDAEDEKIIDNILDLVLHCKDKDLEKCINIVKKFNKGKKTKEDLAKTLALLCSVCNTDVRDIQDKINPPEEYLKEKKEEEEDIKEAVEPTKEELMKEVEIDAKMNIQTMKEKINNAYIESVKQFKKDAETKEDFDLLRRMTFNGDNIYDEIHEIGVQDNDYDTMGLIAISGRAKTILSLREIKSFERKYSEDPHCNRFRKIFVTNCRG